MHRLEQVPKSVVQKQAKGNFAKMLTDIERYVKLQQHFSTKILYCYLNI